MIELVIDETPPGEYPRAPKGEVVNLGSWQGPTRMIWRPPASCAALHKALDTGPIEWLWPEGWK